MPNHIKTNLQFFIIINVFYFLLQCRFMNFFYKWFPGADFIQFPWRLLSFIQVLNLVILASVIFQLMKAGAAKVAYAISLGCLAILILQYPLFKKTNISWFPDDFIESEHQEYGTFGIGEYMPDISHLPAESVETIKAYYLSLHSMGIIVNSGKCAIKQLDSTNLEQLFKRFHIKCTTNSLVTFPYNYSGLEMLFIEKNGKKQALQWYRTDIDPRIHAYLPAGEYTLTIHFPVLKNLFSKKNTLPVKKEQIKINLSDYCDMERQSKDELYFISRENEPYETGYGTSSEKSFSGRYSVKLSDKIPFALKHEITSPKIGEVIEISINRFEKKGTGNLVTEDSSKKYRLEVFEPSEILKDGWQELKIRFYIPNNLPHSKFFLYVYKTSGECVFFDDLVIKRWNR